MVHILRSILLEICNPPGQAHSKTVLLHTIALFDKTMNDGRSWVEEGWLMVFMTIMMKHALLCPAYVKAIEGDSAATWIKNC